MEQRHEDRDPASLIPAPSPKISDSERAQLIKQWLFRFCLNAGVTPGTQELSGMLALHMDALADLSLEQLEAAYRKALNSCKFWPIKIADIREHVDVARKNNLALEAEQSWQKLLDWIRLHYQPDLGIDRRAPQPDAATWQAAKAAGGIGLLWACPEADLVWRKKEFITYYTTIHETGKVEFLLTDAEAKSVLAKISSGNSAPKRERRLEENTRPVEFLHEQPKPTPLRKEFPPKSAGDQIAELRARGWIP